MRHPWQSHSLLSGQFFQFTQRREVQCFAPPGTFDSALLAPHQPALEAFVSELRARSENEQCSVLLAPEPLRLALAGLLRPLCPFLSVLCPAELPPDLEPQCLGSVGQRLGSGG